MNKGFNTGVVILFNYLFVLLYNIFQKDELACENGIVADLPEIEILYHKSFYIWITLIADDLGSLIPDNQKHYPLFKMSSTHHV